MALDEPNKDESAVEVNGLNVLIADEVKVFADESKIDYVEEPWRRGFTIAKEGSTGC